MAHHIGKLRKYFKRIGHLRAGDSDSHQVVKTTVPYSTTTYIQMSLGKEDDEKLSFPLVGAIKRRYFPPYS
jgi:hypothetical protein